MVHFGATLREQRNKDWEQYYIDYDGLKTQLKTLKDAYNSASDTLYNPSLLSLPSWEQSPAAQRDGRGSPSINTCTQHADMSDSIASIRFLRRKLTSTGHGAADEAAINSLENTFSDNLDAEVEKAVLFFLAKQGHLAGQLLDARQQAAEQHHDKSRRRSSFSNGHTPSSTAQIGGGGDGRGGGGDGRWGGEGSSAFGDSAAFFDSFNSNGNDTPGSPARAYELYCEIGRQIVLLMRFLQLNVSGLRKILKKHDKQVRDKLLATNYLTSRARAKYSSMRQLYNNEGIMALVASLRNAFEVLNQERDPASSLDAIQLENAPHQDIESWTWGGDSTTDSAAARAGVVAGWYDPAKHVRLARRPKHRTLSETSATQGVFVEIAKAQRALADAQQQTVSKYLSLQVMLESPVVSGDCDSDSGDVRELKRPSAYINLATTFLYMTNYYIAGPTSAEYAAALGGSPAISGMIIGMTPIAACFSCLLYSWWTNTSFKGPLLLCSWMVAVGNLLYGMALSYDAFSMVLVGRTLIGLGGARGVNRRYIADTIPIESRTAYSAAFVAAGALGMAFGPFSSAVLEGVSFKIGILIFNDLTNPGWIMFVCWVVMALLVQFVFQEPPHRIHIAILGSDEETPDTTPARHRAKVAAVVDDESSRRGRANSASVASCKNDGGKAARGGGGTYGSTGDPLDLVESSRVSSDTDVSRSADAERTGKGGKGQSAGIVGGSGERTKLLPASAASSSSSVGNVGKTDGYKPAQQQGYVTVPQKDVQLIIPKSVGSGGDGDDAVTASKKEARLSFLKRSGHGAQSGTSEDSDVDEAEVEGKVRKGRANNCCGNLSAITPPLGFCLFGYFVNKLITEAAVSSAPVLTQYMFDWSGAEVGVLMAVLGLVVLPVNVVVGRMSLFWEDRMLLQVLAVLTGVGCLIMVDFSFLPFAYSETQYIAGISIVFVALQAHEGVIMSITSKIIPVKLARGTWNSGFLTTEAGTFGRFVGDFFITVMGVMTLAWLDFLLFVPAVVMASQCTCNIQAFSLSYH